MNFRWDCANGRNDRWGGCSLTSPSRTLWARWNRWKRRAFEAFCTQTFCVLILRENKATTSTFCLQVWTYSQSYPHPSATYQVYSLKTFYSCWEAVHIETASEPETEVRGICKAQTGVEGADGGCSQSTIKGKINGFTSFDWCLSGACLAPFFP